MTTAQVVETSFTVNNNSPIQDYVHPDDQSQPTFEKAKLMYKCINNLAPAYLCNLFASKNTELLFSQSEEKINAPKTKNWFMNWLPEA